MRHLLAIAILFVAVGSGFAQETKKPAKRPPNILYIMSDDHASAAIGAYRSFLGKFARTPNLDRLAKGGMLFKNGLVSNSICTPARAAILTGQYSHKNTVYTLNDVMPTQTVHIAHLLRRAGYQTGLIGKWHLGTDPQGFDYWNIFPGQGRYHDPQLREMGHKELTTYKGKYSTDVVTDLTLDWLKKRDKEKPFYMMCHFKAPHRPWDPAPRFKDMFGDEKIPEPKSLLDHYENRSEAAKRAKMRVGENMTRRDLEVDFPKDLKGDDLRRWAYQHYMKRYLACVAAVDENVGRLLDYLDAEGLTENTIVIYTSDQGFFLGEHGWYDKRFMYEECLTTPLIIRYPPLTTPGSVNTDMVMNIDHAPTFLELAGAANPGNMDGKSYVPILKGKTPDDWRKSMYYRYWMHLDPDHNVTGHYGVRTDRYTLIFYYGKAEGMKGAKNQDTTPEWELFDRQTDPGQMRNVVDDPNYARVVSDLKTELERLRTELKDTK